MFLPYPAALEQLKAGAAREAARRGETVDAFGLKIGGADDVRIIGALLIVGLLLLMNGQMASPHGLAWPEDAHDLQFWFAPFVSVTGWIVMLATIVALPVAAVLGALGFLFRTNLLFPGDWLAILTGGARSHFLCAECNACADLGGTAPFGPASRYTGVDRQDE